MLRSKKNSTSAMDADLTKNVRKGEIMKKFFLEAR